MQQSKTAEKSDGKTRLPTEVAYEKTTRRYIVTVIGGPTARYSAKQLVDQVDALIAYGKLGVQVLIEVVA